MKKAVKTNYTIIATKYYKQLRLYGNKKLMRMHTIKTIKEIDPNYNENEFIEYQKLVNQMKKEKDAIKIKIEGRIEINIEIGQKNIIVGNTTKLNKELQITK